MGYIGGNGGSKGINILCGCGVVKVVWEGTHVGCLDTDVVRACALEANMA